MRGRNPSAYCSRDSYCPHCTERQQAYRRHACPSSSSQHPPKEDAPRWSWRATRAVYSQPRKISLARPPATLLFTPERGAIAAINAISVVTLRNPDFFLASSRIRPLSAWFSGRASTTGFNLCKQLIGVPVLLEVAGIGDGMAGFVMAAAFEDGNQAAVRFRPLTMNAGCVCSGRLASRSGFCTL